MNESGENINERFDKKLASYGSLILNFAGDIRPAAKARILETAVYPATLLGLAWFKAPIEAYWILVVLALLSYLARYRSRTNGPTKNIPGG
jgi:hypothetical protein